ncbi:MAG: hypothetical protein V1846_02840 [Candidatus Komeilibacteria bacterium]
MENIPDVSKRQERNKLTPEEMTARLHNYLNDFDDDIPQERVTDGNFKVRNNWLQGALSNIRYTAHFILADASLREEADMLVKQINNRRLLGVEAMERGEQTDSFVPTTKKEIEQVNTLLKKAIDSLQDNI